MLILLSSAARPRYADDIVRVLALPPGTQMNFRYNSTWIEPGLISQIPREQLAGENLLLCFLAGDGRQRPFEIVPLRFARLIRAEQVGTSCVFLFEVGSFADGVRDGDVRDATPNVVRARLPNPAPASAALFAFRASLEPPPRLERPDFSAFEATVSEVTKHWPFTSESSVFYTIFRLSRIPARSWFGTWPKPERAQMGAFRLDGGKRYECEAYCLRPNSAPPRTKMAKVALAIRNDDDVLKFASDTHADIDSSYDVKRFVFFSEPTVLKRVTSLRLFTIKDRDAGQREISVPIILSGSAAQGFLRVFLVGAGTAGPAMVAALAAKNLSTGLAILMLSLGLVAGIGAILPNLRKP